MTEVTVSADSDLGQISSFKLPEGWLEASPAPQMAGRVLRKFCRSDNQSVRFCIYLRGVPVSNPAAAAFQKVLYADFHDLAAEEIASLAEVLEGMSNESAFQFNAAATNYLNNRRALQVEGRWLKPGEDTLCIFIDTDGSGRYIQQIYFTAPAGLLQAHLSEANSMFTSIEWKQKS